MRVFEPRHKLEEWRLRHNNEMSDILILRKGLGEEKKVSVDRI